MKRKIAVNSNTYHGFSVKESIDGIADAGFKYIELTATKGWTEHVFPTHSLSELYEVKEHCTNRGLSVIALSGHSNLMDDERITDFIENMKLAHFFGCTYIVSSIGEAHLENNVTISDEEVAEKIRTFIPHLEKYKLILVLEIHGSEHGSGALIKKITDRINSPYVKINYDTANAIFYGDTDVLEDVKHCCSDIAFMHIKDKAGKKNEWNFPALGEGEVDFVSIFSALDDGQNECPLSIEIEFTEKGPADLNEVNEAVKTSYKYLCGIGAMEDGV